MKDFLHRHVTLISALMALTFAAVFLLFVLLLAAKEQREQLVGLDMPLTALGSLPGPNDRISERSKLEINVLLQGNKHILGGYATKINYAKTEYPVFYYFSKEAYLVTALKNYEAMQKSGRGFSSAELDATNAQTAANVVDAKQGVIRCQPLSTTNIGSLAPGIEKTVKGVCRATIPPFDDNVNLAIVVLIDNDSKDPEDPVIVEIRRTLLQLQIDIYNRDFKGRETWAYKQN